MILVMTLFFIFNDSIINDIWLCLLTLNIESNQTKPNELIAIQLRNCWIAMPFTLSVEFSLGVYTLFQVFNLPNVLSLERASILSQTALNQ